MKKALHILSFAVIALAALTSCAKEQLIENVLPAGEAIQVSINGLIGELTPADATKATAGSVVRVTWENGDKVYVYDGSTDCIGTLTVTPDEKNTSYALLSGTIHSDASPAPSKLTLVYVKGATEAPTIAGGKISIDISTQDQTEVPFVLYTTVDYNAAALTKTNEYISFTFATSVMTVNCTGLPTNEGSKIAITKAEIDGVSKICELTVTGSGVTVAGASKGTITRSETANPSVFTQSDSRGSFRLALAADPAAPAARNILVHQGSKVSGAPFTSATLAGGQSYNTVYQLSEYISDGAGGYAPAVTGVTLAKDETTILVGTKETLEATVAPDNAKNKLVKWSSSDPNIATVDDNGEVTGVAAGSAVITATTEDGNFKAFCLVTVSPTTGTAKAIIGGIEVDVNWVQLWENGPKFAEYNVGAENNKAEDYGGYYAWGGSQNGVDDHNTGSSDLSHTGDNITDTATKLWGSAWRMPTSVELKALINSTNCTVEWIDGTNRKYNNTAVKGLLCTGKGAYASNSVFLPAAGYSNNNGTFADRTTRGHYWSSTPNGSSNAYYLFFSKSQQYVNGIERNYGRSVRAVLAK